MGKKLNTFVTVHDDNGQAHTFGPSDKLPDWAKKSITNPNVWADKADDTSDESETAGEPGAGGDTGSQETSSLVPPPLTGAGSSADAWRDYAGTAAEAAGLQIELDADAKRGDIVEALKAAGIRTE